MSDTACDSARIRHSLCLKRASQDEGEARESVLTPKPFKFGGVGVSTTRTEVLQGGSYENKISLGICSTHSPKGCPKTSDITSEIVPKASKTTSLVCSAKAGQWNRGSDWVYRVQVL